MNGQIEFKAERLDDGGPAFPTLPEHGFNNGEPGMTLRDHFAGQAMPEVYRRVESGGFDRVAALSYELADAMLKARSV